MKGLTAFLIAALAGSAMALQGTFNTAAGKIIGVAENTLVVHLVGAAVMALFLLAGFGRGDWSKFGEIPFYGYLGGVLSAIIIFGVIFAMSSLGVGNATAVIILFQVSAALIIDSFGLFGAEKAAFSWWRILGVVFLCLGTKFVFYKA